MENTKKLRATEKMEDKSFNIPLFLLPAVAILILVPVLLIAAILFPIIFPVNENSFSSDTNSSLRSNGTGQIADYASCLVEKNISLNTVIFVHSNLCPHCQTMMPIVQKLEVEGFKFYWAEGNEQNNSKLLACMSGHLSGYVPEFHCPANSNVQTGAISENELRAFARNCNTSVPS